VQWGVAYYQAPDGSVPAADFLDSCPTKVDANFMAVLEAVRAAPPPAFSGGGKWEAMRGRMAGYYEIRGTGPGRMHYRLFCRLENGTPVELRSLGFDGPRSLSSTAWSRRTPSSSPMLSTKRTFEISETTTSAELPDPPLPKPSSPATALQDSQDRRSVCPASPRQHRTGTLQNPRSHSPIRRDHRRLRPAVLICSDKCLTTRTPPT